MPNRPSPQRLRRYWDRHAAGYDRQMSFCDRHLFTDTRTWICSRAVGPVLEVAIGTGLNQPHYPENVEVTGVEFSRGMLEQARRRAERARPVGRTARGRRPGPAVRRQLVRYDGVHVLPVLQP
jgi:ubiquinone/menaquinone biosynthesis C-methylase UbiE